MRRHTMHRSHRQDDARIREWHVRVKPRLEQLCGVISSQRCQGSTAAITGDARRLPGALGGQFLPLGQGRPPGRERELVRGQALPVQGGRWPRGPLRHRFSSYRARWRLAPPRRPPLSFGVPIALQPPVGVLPRIRFPCGDVRQGSEITLCPSSELRVSKARSGVGLKMDLTQCSTPSSSTRRICQSLSGPPEW